MVRITVLTIFPELFRPFLETSLLGRAVRDGVLDVAVYDIRDHATDRHRSVDDTPYGGGPGMVMRPDVLAAAVRAAEAERGEAHRIFLTPQGRRLDQAKVVELADREHLLLVCGRYEGVDERFRERYIHEEVSIGDYVLAGGELPAMVLVEAICRLLPGVMGNEHSAEEESFGLGGLEYPHYTRPRIFEGQEVPAVLTSGDHAAIATYRRRKALERTARRRPDLLEDLRLTPEEREWIAPFLSEGPTPQTRKHRLEHLRALAGRTHLALLHYPVYDRTRKVVTTAVTNLDIHDIARAARTFGLAGYHVVTPIELQRRLVQRILGHWTTGHGAQTNRPRRQALELVSVHESLEDLQRELADRYGARPVVVATSARRGPWNTLPAERLGEWPQVVRRPVLLLFGTGWGLADEVLSGADLCLEPIEGLDDYNHLSVRSAVSIYLDRLFGRKGAWS